MRTLDTHALTLFCAVARCLNFRQAAEQLHMTQPPLSRAIRLLEERLGTRLFERDTQGVALTQAGRTLLPQALHILDLLDIAQTSLQQDSAPARLRLVAAMRKGQLDAALLALPSATFELAVQPLARQPMMLALPAGHRLAKKRKLSLSDIAAERIYWFERARQPAFFDHCQQVFRRHGFAPTFLREAMDHHVLLSDVAAGKGMALLADSFRALRLAGVAYRPLLEGAELAAGIGLAWHEEHGHAALPLLRQLAQEHLAK